MALIPLVVRATQGAGLDYKKTLEAFSKAFADVTTKTLK
jgi:hypothetical protein